MSYREQILARMTAHLDKEVRGVWQEEDWEPERVAEELLDIVAAELLPTPEGEVERLEAEVKQARKDADDAARHWKESAAEVERLRASTTTADAIKAEQKEQREKFYDPSEPGAPGNDDDRYVE